MKKNTIDQNVNMTVKSLSIVVAALGLSLGTTIESVHATDVSNIQDKSKVYQQEAVNPQTTIQTTSTTVKKVEVTDKTAEKVDAPIQSTPVQSTIKVYDKHP